MTVKGLRLVEIRQSSEAPAIADVSLAVREQVRKLLRRRNLPPGSRVAITAGNRGIRGLPMRLAPFYVSCVSGHAARG